MNRATWILGQLQRERELELFQLEFLPAQAEAPANEPFDPSFAAGAKVLAMLATIAAEIAPLAPPLTL